MESPIYDYLDLQAPKKNWPFIHKRDLSLKCICQIKLDYREIPKKAFPGILNIFLSAKSCLNL